MRKLCLSACVSLVLSACGLVPYNLDYVAAKRAGTPEAYREYLVKHPDSPLSERARGELRGLEATEANQRSAASTAERLKAERLELARATGNIGAMLAAGASDDSIAAAVTRFGKKTPDDLNRYLQDHLVPLLRTLRLPPVEHVAVSILEKSGRPLDAVVQAPRYFAERDVIVFRAATVNGTPLGRMVSFRGQFYELPPTLQD